MIEVWIPFLYETKKEEIKNFYLAFLIRVYVIQWQIQYWDIKKQAFSEALKKQWFDKKRINRIWNYWKAGEYINYIDSNKIILKWKEKVMWENWFLIKVSPWILWFNQFTQFITEIYAIRPVTQTKEFFEEFKFKAKNTAYNLEITKRSLVKKRSRGQRKISTQSWCCLKTANNRLKKTKTIHIIKRYDSFNGFRVNNTNLYLTKENISFFRYYHQNNSTRISKTTLNSLHNAMISTKAIFSNNCLSLKKLYCNLYSIIPLQ